MGFSAGLMFLMAESVSLPIWGYPFFVLGGYPRTYPQFLWLSAYALDVVGRKKGRKPFVYLGLRPSLHCFKYVLGGGKRDRTDDLLHAMQALSQLSYTPNFDANYISRRRHHSLELYTDF